jgi:ParB/RepB/Spo0J family partition protein
MDKAYTLKPGELADVPLSLIDPDPNQPRKDFDEDYINNELVPSIKASGVIQPVIVRSNPEQPGRFLLVDGENRYRASKVAKKKAIPAILREEEGLGLLMIQLKTLQRRGLNPIEWAQSFITMHKVHGLKYTEIEKTLKDNGVGQYGRSYISNIVRLLDLPEWAQTLIRNNAITAAHGKYIIPAMASEKVLAGIEKKFTIDNWHPTTVQLQQEIFWAFGCTHKNLTGDQTDFDYRETCVKTGCQKMRKLTLETGGEGTFCLDEACHAVLQAEAERKQAEKDGQEERSSSGNGGSSGVREVVINDGNRVHVEQQELRFHRDYRQLSQAGFDIRACATCQHRHIAITDEALELEEAGEFQPDADDDCCFLVSCYIAKEDEAKRAKRLLRQFMQQEITSALTPARAMRLLAWCAAQFPSVRTSDKGESIITGYSDIEGEDGFDDELFRLRLTSLEQFMDADDGAISEFGAFAMRTFDDDDLLALFTRLKLSIEDYRIDAAFLAEHTAEELDQLLNAVKWKAGTFAELGSARRAGEVDKFAIEHAALIGVPAAIRHAFEKITATPDDEATFDVLGNELDGDPEDDDE